MLSAAYSAGLAGIDGFPVTVECNVRDKLEGFELVGLPDAAVREANMSSERVLWIRAKTQSGLPRSFTVELSQKDKETKKQIK